MRRALDAAAQAQVDSFQHRLIRGDPRTLALLGLQPGDITCTYWRPNPKFAEVLLKPGTRQRLNPRYVCSGSTATHCILRDPLP
jgi:hypothetical protein